MSTWDKIYYIIMPIGIDILLKLKDYYQSMDGGIIPTYLN